MQATDCPVGLAQTCNNPPPRTVQVSAAMVSPNLKDQDERLPHKHHWLESPLQRL